MAFRGEPRPDAQNTMRSRHPACIRGAVLSSPTSPDCLSEKGQVVFCGIEVRQADVSRLLEGRYLEFILLLYLLFGIPRQWEKGTGERGTCRRH